MRVQHHSDNRRIISHWFVIIVVSRGYSSQPCCPCPNKEGGHSCNLTPLLNVIRFKLLIALTLKVHEHVKESSNSYIDIMNLVIQVNVTNRLLLIVYSGSTVKLH